MIVHRSLPPPCRPHAFHQFYQEDDFPVYIEQVYSPDEDSKTACAFGLTPEQRKTLFRAVDKGYFSVPRETKLEDIADLLRITWQAASERVRRGAETVLRNAPLGLGAETFGSPNGASMDIGSVVIVNRLKLLAISRPTGSCPHRQTIR